MTSVAVVVPHFRQGPYLAACLDSLLAQTRPPDEIIVIDSSPTETATIVQRYAGRIVHLVRPPAGVAAARNAGLAATSCELISFLDADNVATPDRIERQLRVFERERDVILCHGALVPVDQHGRGYADQPSYTSTQVALPKQLGWMIERNRIATDTVCARRDVIVALGSFCEAPGVREDYDLWLRLASVGRFRYVDAPLALYRRHETNLSNDEAYMFDWEAGALRRIGWLQTRSALRQTFPQEDERLVIEGEVRLRRGERALAEQHFKALARGRHAAPALFHLAHLRIDDNALDEAWMLLRRAMGEDPENPALHNNLGVVLARVGEPALAAEAFARAVELNAVYADARRNLEGLRARTTRPGDLKLTRRRLRPQLMPMSPVA